MGSNPTIATGVIMKRNKLESNPSVDKKVTRNKEMEKAGKCDRCPCHAKENEGRKPKPDKHKNARRVKKRK